MSYESERYETVKKFRVKEVEDACRFHPEPLLKQPAEIDGGVKYEVEGLADEEFPTLEEALTTIRDILRNK